MLGSVRIAIIDDDKEMLRILAKFLGRHGIDSDVFSDPRIAIKQFGEIEYGVVISDVQMPGMSGIELLEHVKAIHPNSVVLMMSGFGSIKSAVNAMKKGALDYISKPFDYDEFLVILNKAISQYKLQNEVSDLRRRLGSQNTYGEMIGKSPKMRYIFDLISRVARTKTNVLIEGESGTGKELIARAIHYTGIRKEMPFVGINCGALPESLLDSELFGHVRGAYTGAVAHERGLFVSADTGTIFLDEIADMPMAMQAKLLRVLEDWEIRPVGGSIAKKIDVRVLAASKENLAMRVEAGKFREDLFYRLNVVTIQLPPLRERQEDIHLLLDKFLFKYSREMRKETLCVTREALEAMMKYAWPGNVRELENIVERAVIMCRNNQIELADLPRNIVGQVAFAQHSLVTKENITLQDMEKEHILFILEQAGWKRSRAAELLGINRRTLYRKIQEYGITQGKVE